MTSGLHIHVHIPPTSPLTYTRKLGLFIMDTKVKRMSIMVKNYNYQQLEGRGIINSTPPWATEWVQDQVEGLGT